MNTLRITPSISWFFQDWRLDFSVPPCSVAVQDRLRLPLMTALAGIDTSVGKLHHFSYSAEHAQSLKQRMSPSTARRIIECAIYESVCFCTTSRATMQAGIGSVHLRPTTSFGDDPRSTFNSLTTSIHDTCWEWPARSLTTCQRTPAADSQVANPHGQTTYQRKSHLPITAAQID